jgi:hypothetical protein
MHAAQAMAASTIRRLEALKVADLQQEARKMGVTDDALAEVEQRDDESMTVAQMKRCCIELIAMAPLEVELSISQRGGSSCVCIQARCLHQGGDDSDDGAVVSGRRHHGVLWGQLSPFERALTSVVDELWKGCSFTVSEGGNGIAEGVPPSLLRSSTATPTSCLDELEPEPEPEPELQPEMEPEPKLAM